MNITWPDDYTGIINSIRGAIGRNIIIYNKYDLGPCPICGKDSLLGETLDPFCTTCSGTGVLSVVSGTTILAHVLWGKANSEYKSPAGTIFTGDCKVTVEFSESVLSKIELSSTFLVDDKDLYLIDYDLKGVPEPNRITCYLEQDPREGR